MTVAELIAKLQDLGPGAQKLPVFFNDAILEATKLDRKPDRYVVVLSRMIAQAPHMGAPVEAVFGHTGEKGDHL